MRVEHGWVRMLEGASFASTEAARANTPVGARKKARAQRRRPRPSLFLSTDGSLAGEVAANAQTEVTS